MANTAQAKKRARQNDALRRRNMAQRSEFRTAIKSLLKLIATGNKSGADAQLRITASTLDRIADKGIFHKNKAARHKSRLTAAVKAMA